MPIIDEAQDLSAELLEQVRLLSNLETDRRKLLQIVLIGQPELRAMLDDRGLRQLRQRITVRYHLTPLDRDETELYVHYRLQVAGGNGRPTFTRWALSPRAPLLAGRTAADQRGSRHLAARRLRRGSRSPRAG